MYGVFQMLLSRYLVIVEKNVWAQLWWSTFRMTFLKKNYYNSDGSPSHTIVLSYQCFYNKNKDENTEYHGTIISFKNRINSKQDSPIFLLYGSWIVGLSQSFSDYSNLIIFVNIQHLYENSKWILCVSNRVNIVFK